MRLHPSSAGTHRECVLAVRMKVPSKALINLGPASREALGLFARHLIGWLGAFGRGSSRCVLIRHSVCDIEADDERTHGPVSVVTDRGATLCMVQAVRRKPGAAGS